FLLVIYILDTCLQCTSYIVKEIPMSIDIFLTIYHLIVFWVIVNCLILVSNFLESRNILPITILQIPVTILMFLCSSRCYYSDSLFGIINSRSYLFFL